MQVTAVFDMLGNGKATRQSIGKNYPPTHVEG